MRNGKSDGQALIEVVIWSGLIAFVSLASVRAFLDAYQGYQTMLQKSEITVHPMTSSKLKKGSDR